MRSFRLRSGAEGFPHNSVLRKRSERTLMKRRSNILSTQFCPTETRMVDYTKDADGNIFPHNSVLRKLGVGTRVSSLGASNFPHNSVLRKHQFQGRGQGEHQRPFHTILSYGNTYHLQVLPASRSPTFPHNSVLRKQTFRNGLYIKPKFFPHNSVLRKPSETCS